MGGYLCDFCRNAVVGSFGEKCFDCELRAKGDDPVDFHERFRFVCKWCGATAPMHDGAACGHDWTPLMASDWRGPVPPGSGWKRPKAEPQDPIDWSRTSTWERDQARKLVEQAAQAWEIRDTRLVHRLLRKAAEMLRCTLAQLNYWVLNPLAEPQPEPAPQSTPPALPGGAGGSIEDVSTGVRAAQGKTEEGIGALGQARAALEEAQGLLTRAVEGGDKPDQAEALSLLGQALDCLTEVEQAATGAVRATEGVGGRL